MAQSSAAAASTSTAPNSDHDVFINHRGLDVKKTFASHLYRRLQSFGLRVFLDQPELQRGDYFAAQIEGAIRYASVHVAIFSSGYAESTWCLRELVLMLQSNSPVIPVFYKVKPEDLRWTRGKEGGYAKALEELEKKTSTDPQTGEEKLRYDPSLIQNWRNAFFEAAGISGFELEACNGDEGELVDNVVEEVLKRVKKPVLNVAKYPTGLDDKVTDFENTVILPQQHAGKPPIVGITGLGGVGKTTLAKEVFNRKSSGYSRCCFLADVRDNADKGSLHLLQRELLKSLTGLDEPIINSVHEGKTILRKHISSPNILVMLDDVDKMDQVDELLPDQTVLHSDSLILITSRSKDVLKMSGVAEESIYNLNGLPTQYSLELFCLYFFNQPHPLPGFESLAKKFIEACGGLPLSLKVFGALLNGQEDASYWEAQLDRLQRILPKEIKQRLQISYDALDMEDRQIFLDIACFLIGEDRDRVIRICDGSGGKGSWGFRNLENKCLVEVNSANKIRMHDHLRDMGREIADGSLPRRLWRSTEKIDHLLQQSSVINEVRGIRMTDNSSVMPRCQRSSELFWHCFMKFCNKQYPFHGSGIGTRNLQLLHSRGVLVKRILTKVQFPNLVWLRWDSCPYSSLHLSISYLKNLRVLQVEGSKLKTLWKKESQAPLQLRELEIKAPLSSIPKSIGKLTQLERIVIRPYEWKVKVTVTQLPEEFCFLQSLKALVLDRFSEMKSLPECFGKLSSLHRIDLFGCYDLRSLPDSLGDLSSLHHINLSSCNALERLPDSFCKLIKLQHLDLSGCINLTMPSETLGNVSTLLYINLKRCRKVEVLPPQVLHQVSLRQLFLTDTNIKELPSAIGELHDLEVLEVSALLEVLPPSLCSLKSLKVLRLYDCKELKCLPASLGDLRNLKELRIERCRELKSLPASLGRLAQLTKLCISGCRLIPELPFLPSSDLESSIDHCILPRLRYLDLSRTGISEISFAEGVCFNLRNLIMGNCYSLVEVGILPNTLTSLTLDGCHSLRKMDNIYGLAKLRALSISCCRELEELPCIETLVSLRKLSADSCVKLKGFRGLGQLTKLDQLDVYGCLELEEVEGIQHCMSLEKLDATECPKLQWDAGVVEQLRQRMGSAFDYDYRRGGLEQLRQQMGSAFRMGSSIYKDCGNHGRTLGSAIPFSKAR